MDASFGPVNHNVEVFLRGGLGNQLFQYAAGYALSRLQNSPLELRTDLLPIVRDDIEGISRWPESLSEFAHCGSLRSMRNQPPGGTNFFSKRNSAFRVLSDLTGELLPRAGFFYGDSDRDWAQVAKQNRAKKLSSYFISPDFAYEFEGDLRHQIGQVVRPSDDFKRSCEAVNGRMAVHIRLGDFETVNPKIQDEMLGYLRRATNLARQLNPDSLGFALFSDQPDRAAEILESLSKSADIWMPPPGLRPIEELNLIGKARGLIGSASTFSWWGGFLQTKRDAPIILPRPWEKTLHTDKKNVLPRDWIQVG